MKGCTQWVEGRDDSPHNKILSNPKCPKCWNICPRPLVCPPILCTLQNIEGPRAMTETGWWGSLGGSKGQALDIPLVPPKLKRSWRNGVSLQDQEENELIWQIQSSKKHSTQWVSMVTATEGLHEVQSWAEYIIWSYVEKSLGVLRYRGKVLKKKNTQIFNSELANVSTVDPWTMRGLGVPTSCIVENPWIMFDSPRTTKSLLLTRNLTDNINS